MSLPLGRLERDGRLPRPEYGRNLRSLIGICRTNGVNVVLVNHPANYRDDLTPEEEGLLFFPTPRIGKRFSPDDMAWRLKRYNERAREVATC